MLSVFHNSQEAISVANWDLHELHCARHRIKCPNGCGEMIVRNNIEVHIADRHRKETCPLCSQMIEVYALETHTKVLVHVFFVNLELSFSDSSNSSFRLNSLLSFRIVPNDQSLVNTVSYKFHSHNSHHIWPSVRLAQSLARNAGVAFNTKTSSSTLALTVLRTAPQAPPPPPLPMVPLDRRLVFINRICVT